MRKYITTLFIAAAALAGCTREEPLEGGYTLTIQASKGEADSGTRALSLDGKTLNEKWDGTEKVLVYRTRDGHSTYIGTLSATASETGRTTLKGLMSISPDPETDNLDFYYLDSRCDYTGQDGKLSTLSQRYDFCEEETLERGRYHVGGRNIIIDELLTINFRLHSQAIVKFILQDPAGKAVKPTRLTISGDWVLQYNDRISGAYEYGGALTFEPLSGETNEVFAALHTLGRSDDWTLALDAETAAGDRYRYEKTAKTFFDDGKYYEITVDMTKLP